MSSSWGFWHFHTVNNNNWGLICVGFCSHPDIFDVLHLKSVKLDENFEAKMKLHTSYYLRTAVRI